ncbi:MAG TPA: VWA domain-containing protein [Tepidisphaeraceae bacterium]|nr:VWA domain-containing protein [Tepidisphaeraceae bacterium]
MSWWPTYLNPWAAAAAGAVVVPSLLILYFLKLRRREMTVPSTLLWKKAVQDLQVNAPFQKLRRNLLLLLQLLLLLLLLLAFSRPVTNYSPGAGTTTVILIDRSASMGTADPDLKGGTRLDEAKRRARDLVETVQRNSQAMVIAFDESAETISPLSSDIPALKRSIDSIQQTDKKSRLKLAYQLAEAQASFNPEQLRPGAGSLPDVWVYSDGRVADAAELSVRGNLKYDKIGSDKAGNIAIVAMNAKRNYERPTEVQIFARLANFGPEPVNADVQLSVDGKVRAVAGTSLAPERWPEKEREKVQQKDSVEFNIELTTAGVIKVEQMHREGDALPADNAASVVVPPPKNLGVLLVSEGNFFLELAMKSLSLQNPQQLLPAAYETQQPANFDVIIFDRYRPKFLPPAGNFVYFGATPPEGKLTGEPAVYTPQPPARKKVVGVIDWKRDHPVLRHLQLGTHGFADPLKLTVPQEAEVLMEGPAGPLMVLYKDKFATHFVMGFDVIESTWPLKPSFPVFMHNLMQFLAVGSEMDVRPQLEPGATPRFQRAALARIAPGLASVRVNGPGGSREETVPPQGDFALKPLDRVGLYETQPPLPPFERVAVNLLDYNESNVVPVDQAPGGVGEAVAASGGKSRLELWWWIIACAALPLLLVEWWVYTRRVHL